MTEPTTMQVDTAMVRELAELLDATNLTEIEVRDGERQIKVVRKHGGVAVMAPVATPAPVVTAAAPAAAAVAGDDWASHAGLVRSPIVGTAYLTPEPGAPPYVTEGGQVTAGETLLIIEAMKVMNPITAPKSGKVVRIMIANEQPVEYDEPLIVIG